MKNSKQSVEQNSASIETIAGQLVAMQMLLETVIIDGIRSGALSSDLFTAAIGQAMESFPKNKTLAQMNSSARKAPSTAHSEL